MIKNVIITLLLIAVLIFGGYAQDGTYTTNDYFYRPLFGASGITEFDEFNAYLEIADNQIEANRIGLDLNVKEEGTGDIVKGQPVYLSGATGQAFPKVGLADADSATKTYPIGLAVEAISQNTRGIVRIEGVLGGVDSLGTTAINPGNELWAANQLLYLNTTAGGLTKTEPTVGRVVEVGHSLYGSSNTDAIHIHIQVTHPHIEVVAGEDVILRLGDSAGLNKVIIKGYDNIGVAYMDSDGGADFNSLLLDTALPAIEGGTGKATITADSFLKGAAGNTYVERTYGEVRTDLGIDLSLYYLKTEIDTFSKLDTIVADKSLLNKEDVATIAQVWTFSNNQNLDRANDNADYAPYYALRRAHADSPYASVESGDYLGMLRFYGWHTDNFQLGAEIRATVDAAPADNAMPSKLEFLTSASGSNVPTLAMTISSTQVVTFANDLTDSEISDTLTASILTGELGGTLDFNNERTQEVKTIEFDGLYDNGASGATPTIDWRNGQYQKIATDENTLFTFSNPFVGTITLIINYGGDHTVGFDGAYTIREVGGVEIVFTELSGTQDQLSIRYLGTADTYTVGALLDVKD